MMRCSASHGTGQSRGRARVRTADMTLISMSLVTLPNPTLPAILPTCLEVGQPCPDRAPNPNPNHTPNLKANPNPTSDPHLNLPSGPFPMSCTTRKTWTWCWHARRREQGLFAKLLRVSRVREEDAGRGGSLTRSREEGAEGRGSLWQGSWQTWVRIPHGPIAAPLPLARCHYGASAPSLHKLAPPCPI